jgi:hypothetical protein
MLNREGAIASSGTEAPAGEPVREKTADERQIEKTDRACSAQAMGGVSRSAKGVSVKKHYRS